MSAIKPLDKAPQIDKRTLGKSGRPRKVELIEALIDIFIQQGCYGHSIRSLASAIGISAPTLLHHFDGHDGMMEDVATHLQTEFYSAFRDHAAKARNVVEIFWLNWHHIKTRGPEFWHVHQNLVEICSKKNPEFASATQARNEKMRKLGRDLLVADGVSDETAELVSKIGAVTYRGLLMEFVETRDVRATDQRMKLVMSWIAWLIANPDIDILNLPVPLSPDL